MKMSSRKLEIYNKQHDETIRPGLPRIYFVCFVETWCPGMKHSLITKFFVILFSLFRPYINKWLRDFYMIDKIAWVSKAKTRTSFHLEWKKKRYSIYLYSFYDVISINFNRLTYLQIALWRNLSEFERMNKSQGSGKIWSAEVLFDFTGDPPNVSSYLDSCFVCCSSEFQSDHSRQIKAF